MKKQSCLTKEFIDINNYMDGFENMDNEHYVNHKACRYCSDEKDKTITMIQNNITPYKKDDWIKNG